MQTTRFKPSLRQLLAQGVLALPLMLAACGGSIGLDLVYFDDGTQEVPFQTLAAPPASAITQARMVVVRDLSSWDTLWREHVANLDPQPPLPAVNFSQDMVIGIFLGSRSNACYRVVVESVTELLFPRRLQVVFRELTPPANAVCAAVLTNPAVLVLVPYTSLPVEFIHLVASA